MAVMGGGFFSPVFNRLIRQAPCEGPVEQIQGREEEGWGIDVFVRGSTANELEGLCFTWFCVFQNPKKVV